MAYSWPVAACLLALLALALGERLLRDRALAAIPIRIHVNGTRGKSTVTRLIAAALRGNGIVTLAKVTGTAPRFILPDGSERPVPRRGAPNVREQLRFLLRAHRMRAEAVVIECMAIRPDLQHVAEHDMVRATVGVITNVRTDHTEVMGSTLADIAAALSNTVPRGADLVLGDPATESFFRARAGALGTRITVAASEPVPDRTPAGAKRPAWLRQNLATALAVTRLLGLDDDGALAAMGRAGADPGAAVTRRVAIAGSVVDVLDATAANDPESLAGLLADWDPKAGLGARLAFVYNHRADRPDRLRRFARSDVIGANGGRVLLTGDRPAATLWRAVRRELAGRPAAFVPVPDLQRALRTAAADADGIVFCGNTRGIDVARTLQGVTRG